MSLRNSHAAPLVLEFGVNSLVVFAFQKAFAVAVDESADRRIGGSWDRFLFCFALGSVG